MTPKIAAAAAALAAALALASQGTTQVLDPQKPRPRIELRSTLERITVTGFGEARYYLLWNRTVRTRPVGHSLYGCRRVSGSSICTALFSLPLGKLVAVGEIRRFSRYTMVVTGGSRCYAAAEPAVVGAWPLEPGTNRLIFSLTSTC